jgi:hypothetical protein
MNHTFSDIPRGRHPFIAQANPLLVIQKAKQLSGENILGAFEHVTALVPSTADSLKAFLGLQETSLARTVAPQPKVVTLLKNAGFDVVASPSTKAPQSEVVTKTLRTLLKNEDFNVVANTTVVIEAIIQQLLKNDSLDQLSYKKQILSTIDHLQANREAEKRGPLLHNAFLLLDLLGQVERAQLRKTLNQLEREAILSTHLPADYQAIQVQINDLKKMLAV